MINLGLGVVRPTSGEGGTAQPTYTMRLVAFDGQTRLKLASHTSSITTHYVLSLWVLQDEASGYAAPYVSDPEIQYENWFNIDGDGAGNLGFGAAEEGSPYWYKSWAYDVSTGGPQGKLAHILMAARSDGSGVLYLNGARQTPPVLWGTLGLDFIFNGKPFFLGDDLYDDWLTGALGDFALYNTDGLNEAGTDISAGLLAKFRKSSGLPADIGADGLAPGLGVPEIFLSVRDGETVAAYLANRGTGGDFVVDTGDLVLSELVADEDLIFLPPPPLEPLVDVVVDSVNGADEGEGPFLTFEHAQRHVAEITETVSLATDSAWREMLEIDWTGITVQPTGDGDIPIIDATRIITEEWQSMENEVYPHLWRIDVSRGSVSGQQWWNIWEDGIHPRFAKRAVGGNIDFADLETYGGWCVAESEQNEPTAVIFIRAEGDPNTDGVVREIIARDHCIVDTIGGVTVEGPMELRGGSAQYGCLSLKAGSAGRQLLLVDGGIHHSVTAGDLMEDVILWGSPGIGIGAGALTFYRDDGTGWEPMARRVMMLAPGGADRSPFANGSISTHGGSQGADNFIIDQCVVRGAIGLDQMNADAYEISNCFIEDPIELAFRPPSSVAGSIDRVLVRETAAWIRPSDNLVLGVFGITLWDDGEAQTISDFVSSTYRGSYAGAGHTFSHCTFHGPRDDDGAATGVAGSAHTFCIFDAAFGVAGGATGYTGDYNIFTTRRTDLGEFFATGFGGVGGISSLAEWQTASGGQDANSVYVKRIDQTRGNAYALWLGRADDENDGPADGDFRINPNARVYDASGAAHMGQYADGTPITEAGAQSHWDFNAREIAAGPPSYWPALPQSLEEARDYIQDPEGWRFVPA